MRTFLEIRMSNELVGPEVVAKSLFDKRLDICGTSRQSVHSRFLSTTSVRLFPAFFVGLGSFCLDLWPRLVALGTKVGAQVEMHSMNIAAHP